MCILKGSKGIIAARNPLITAGFFEVDLSAENGTRSSANLSSPGSVSAPVDFPKTLEDRKYCRDSLAGYETAIYELFPLAMRMNRSFRSSVRRRPY